MRFTSCACLLFLPAFAPVACRSAFRPSAARYVVTNSPIDVGVGTDLCVAVDPINHEGIWWWEPGTPGCASRSTGPGVFHAENAAVSQLAQAGPVTLRFRLPTHSVTHPFVDVRLLMEDDGLRDVETGARVRVQRRNDLDVPQGS